jgi:hypothetical protein
MEALARSFQAQPDPSPYNDPVRRRKVATKAHCHGCGEIFESKDLKRCTKCKRVYYCSQPCQAMDWKAPRKHKAMCQEGLLALALDNIYRLPAELKMSLLAKGMRELVPNHQFCQTVAKISCPDLDTFLDRALEEFKLLRTDFLETTAQKAAQVKGNCLDFFVQDNRYGVDPGVEALVAALSLWPDIYTVNSCSAIHNEAWIQLEDGSPFCEDFVKIVSDDREALNQVSAILETGAVGIRFKVSPEQYGLADTIANKPGFLVIDYQDDEKSNIHKTCRTYCRVMQPTEQPFDKLDSMLWAMTSSARPPQPPVLRMHSNLVGLFGVALELIQANPILQPTESQQTKLQVLHDYARIARMRIISDYARIMAKCKMPGAVEMLKRLEKENWWEGMGD